MKLLELNQEDSQKTALKKRSNRLFSGALRAVDPELLAHFQAVEVHPELVFLKWLRCLLAREFTI
jgi:hypothetical protein